MSLVKFPDLIEPITRVNREIRLLNEVLLRGDAYEYRRELAGGQPDLDLSSVASRDTAALFAIDLSYQVDPDQRVFSFETAKPIQVKFRLPKWLQEPVGVFRLDADGTHDITHQLDSRDLVIHDQIHVAGIYMVTINPSLRDQLRVESARLLAKQDSVDFDPAKSETDLQKLKSFLD